MFLRSKIRDSLEASRLCGPTARSDWLLYFQRQYIEYRLFTDRKEALCL